MLEMQETQVQPLDQEDPLEKGMATHSNILAQKIQFAEEPGGLQSMQSQRNRHYALHIEPLRYEVNTMARKKLGC